MMMMYNVYSTKKKMILFTVFFVFCILIILLGGCY